MILCPRCAEVIVSARRCGHCGADLACGASTRPSAVVLLGLIVTGCDLVVPSPKAIYGAPDSGYIDEDDDGYPDSLDCDDADPDIHPDAEETVGDGVDSNCDGEDDT